MEIRILPGNVANMIAAGEVVSRPASVVKELMENAVDAGASNISVIIQDAGRTLIQVIDDGCGMSPDEAVLCFERHATSKIRTAEDLLDIHSFGFRGEALASIAAVARVVLRTRRSGDETGCEVTFAASAQESITEVSTSRGSNFAVRDLFYNIPARRKFLKSDNVEFKHIVEEFTKVALSRPDIGFNLSHNGRDIYVLKAAKSMKFRIQDLLGSDAAQEVLDVHAETSVVSVDGYVGKPASARKSLGNQYFFVNGRFFRSPYFHKAVLKAYEGLIPDGVTPSYVLFLEVPPASVDVNISPTKTEIKFEEDSIVFQTIYACIKEAMGKLSFGDSIEFDRGGLPEMPVFSGKFEEYHPVSEPGLGFDVAYNPFDNDGFPSETDTFHGGASGQTGTFPEEGGDGGFSGVAGGGAPASFHGTSQYVSHDQQSYGALFDGRAGIAPSSITIQGRYILTAVKSGLMVINIRRAKERILFERFLPALSGGVHVSQTSLFPESVRIGVENCLLLQENAQLLSSLGFDIRPFGNDTVVVNGVPDGYSIAEGQAGQVLDFVIDALKDNPGGLDRTMTATLAEKFARIGASSLEPMTNPVQAQRLIDSLFACPNAEFTNSGRRTMVLIGLDEIEKKF